MISMIAEKEGTGSIKKFFEDQKQQALLARTEAIEMRKARLRKLRGWIRNNRPAIQQALYDDFKKPALEVDATEVFPALNEISHTLSHIDAWTKPRKVDAPITMLGTRAWVRYEPRGVCLIIAPWNYPFNLCVGPLISALAAGNCAILKPSEITPHTSSLIKKMCDEIFDEKTVAVCQGGVEVSQFLLSLPFDHIFFTGSPAVGKAVMKAAAENLTSVTLELGGKSPAIVLPGARMKDTAKRIAVTKFINNGQTCIAPDYVLVHESIASEFNQQVTQQVLVHFGEMGKPFQESPHYARIVNDKHFARLTDLITDAVEKGAVLHTGGPQDESTRFIHPVILSNVSLKARIMEEEIFGPVLPVLTFNSLDDALRIINERPKPLALYMYGPGKKERDRIIRETSSGSVCINDSAVQFLHHNLPFGGVNNSGIGKSHGYYGFLAFSNEKPVLKQKNGFTAFQPFFPPYTNTAKKMMDFLLKMI